MTVETAVEVYVVSGRLDTRKDAMGRLIDALPTDAASISQPAVKSVLHVLLSATHADDVSCSLILPTWLQLCLFLLLWPPDHVIGGHYVFYSSSSSSSYSFVKN